MQLQLTKFKDSIPYYMEQSHWSRQTGSIWLTDILSKERELTDSWKETKAGY